MAYTTVNKGTDHFNTVQWAGNGSAGRNITGVGFQPDWVWIKNKSRSSNHTLVDVLRGSGSYPMSTSTNGAQDSGDTNQVSALISDGFTVGSSTNTNANGENLVGWNWKAGNGVGSSNTDGSINTTYTSVNSTAGFSISTYTGTGSAATIGHGLGVAPKMVLVKRYNTTGNWTMYHHIIGATKYIYLNSTAVEATASSIWNDTAPTSSVFSVGTDGEVNGSGSNYVAYVFAEKTGFSKFGLYEGNGSTDGTFVYTGFKPAWVILKGKGNSSGNWGIHDSVRDVDNPVTKGLISNSNAAEDTSTFMDFFSNGFKLRSSSANRNGSGQGYIYWAFAEEPLVGSNDIPTLAR